MSSARRNAIERDNRGLAIGLLVVALIVLLLVVDFCLFNIVRVLMVQRQINGICEAGALAGTAKLTKIGMSGNDIDKNSLAQMQKQACACAENMILQSNFVKNSSGNVSKVLELSDLGNELKPGACQYFIKLADPKENHAIVEFGDLRGRSLSCSIAYGYKPLFLDLGNICYSIIGNAIGGLPQIDTILALDLSRSLDDETAVTFVRREWVHSPLGAGNFPKGNITTGTNGCGIIQYVSLHCPVLPQTLSNYLGVSYDSPSSVINGSWVNVLPPQNLDKANSSSAGEITHPMHFNAYLRSHYSNYDSKQRYKTWEAAHGPYYRALDFATPPGNCDLSVGFGGNGDAGSDLDGKPALPTQSTPKISAFSDLTWEEDKESWLGYQPAAPGATHGLVENDPIPSPDQQAFTDLVVNITDPNLTGSKNGSDRSSYNQPLSGPDSFVGFSYTFPANDPDILLRNQTFHFLNIGVVVEAARGNLESTPVLDTGLKNGQMALIDRQVSVDGMIFDMRVIEPKDGYQRAYQRLAMLFTQPLASILAAVDKSYIQQLHTLADCRFGLVGFSSRGSFKGFSTLHNRTFGTMNDQSIDPTNARSFYICSNSRGDPNTSNAIYDSGIVTTSGINDTLIEDGEGRGFRIPRIPLSAEEDHYVDLVSQNRLKGAETNNRLNYGAGANGIYNCRPQSLSDTAEALQTARMMFQTNSCNRGRVNNTRAVANKVIILFVNGEPTGGINSNEGRETLRVAGKDNQISGTCESDGIAVCTVSLNLAKGKAFNKLKERQALFLNDKPPEPGELGGIAWRAGHGSRYYPCENISELGPAFCDMTRRFSQCQN